MHRKEIEEIIVGGLSAGHGVTPPMKYDPLDWDFMVGTASDRDFYQPSLQCAGKHRSGCLFPVAEPVASHALRMHIDHSALSHQRMLIIAAGGIF